MNEEATVHISLVCMMPILNQHLLSLCNNISQKYIKLVSKCFLAVFEIWFQVELIGLLPFVSPTLVSTALFILQLANVLFSVSYISSYAYIKCLQDSCASRKKHPHIHQQPNNSTSPNLVTFSHVSPLLS